MKKKAIALIKGYQEATKAKNPSCRYRPSCSNYAIDCFDNYNFFLACLLALWRILRCNPLSNGGYDPIPKKKKQFKLQQLKETFDPLK